MGNVTAFKENWDIEHSMVVYSGSNTHCKSSEPLKTLVMLCYVVITDSNQTVVCLYCSQQVMSYKSYH